MNKELKELLDKINAKKAEVRNLTTENKIEEAKAAKKELIDLQAKFDLLYDLEEEEETEVKNKITDGVMTPINDNIEKSIKDFASAARRGFRVKNSLSSGIPEDGGYTVPEDIQTKINKYRDAKSSLKDFVKVEKVTTNKGQRTFKTRSQQTGFSKVGEGGKIKGKNTPKFERISFEISKYAGYFPVTNELLADSDVNITNTIIEWIGDESRVTANKLILEQISSITQVNLEDLNGIKKALNVTLGQAFKTTSKIITNDDGLQYLDTLRTSEGMYLLQPVLNEPTKLRLTAGATTVPIEVIPNDDLPTNGNKVPFIIGDLKEGIIFWDRSLTTIKASDIAAVEGLNAFEEDLTLFRAIEREDVTIRDKKAIVNGYIEI